MPAPQTIDRRVRLPLILAGAVLAAITAFVGVRALGSDESQTTPRPELQRILDSLVTGHGRIAPGVAAYVRGSKGTWTGSAGLANVTTGEAMPVDARIGLECVSKIWTGTLVLQLAQEGRLRLGDRVERWLPACCPTATRSRSGSCSRIAAGYRERIFEPLGLEHSAYDPQGPIAGPHAHGYALAANGTLRDASAWHGGIGAEGGLVSDTKDTAVFLTALMHGRLLDARTLAAMKRDAFWSGGEAAGCGGVAYGHSGGGSGYKTDVWVSGDGSRVAVLLLNGRSSDNGDQRAGAAMRELYCEG